MSDSKTTKETRNMRWGWAYLDNETGWRFSFVYLPGSERMTVALFRTMHREGVIDGG